ncbi:MAG: septum formation initiator family protein [Desulfobacterales bacterium]
MGLRQKILLGFVIAALFSLLLFIIFGENGVVDLHVLKVKRDNLLKRNAVLSQENLSLYREIERLRNDPKYVENVARQELGLIGKDEVIIKVKKEQKVQN